jgi:hypothetical protein
MCQIGGHDALSKSFLMQALLDLSSDIAPTAIGLGVVRVHVPEQRKSMFVHVDREGKFARRVPDDQHRPLDGVAAR